MQEVFGQAEEGSVTVMVMKSPAGSAASGSAGSAVAGGSVGTGEGERMTIDLDGFWEGVREVIMARYPGEYPKEEVVAAFKRGYQDAFGT